MSDTANFDVVEKVNILFKSSMGFPSTKETTPWFQETSIIYNNYYITIITSLWYMVRMDFVI